MKAKKVYEFINPKIDKYELEDTLPLGPKAVKLKRVENALLNNEIDSNDMDIKIGKDLVILKFKKLINIGWNFQELSEEITGKIIINYNENKFWYLDGERHREDGPAVEYANGNKSWWLNGERHRVDGPAVENANGNKSWWLNGECHRVDGPAVENANGTKMG